MKLDNPGLGVEGHVLDHETERRAQQAEGVHVGLGEYT